jgi:transcriptional regulator with XRE-family HTH domain
MAKRESVAREERSPAHSANQSGDSLATVVRRLRREAGLTLQELGERCGLGASTISKIENKLISPTYDTILALADGLGVDVAELFSGRSSGTVTGRRSLTRRNEGVRQKTPQYDYEMLCSDIARKQFIPLVTTIRAHSRTEFSELVSHAGEEFIYVLSGKVTLHTQHYEPLLLNPGDSCYFDSTMGHACVSASKEDAVILWVCSRVQPPLAA